MDLNQIKLDYLGRVHGSLLALGRSSNRLVLASLLLNGVVVAVLAGGVSLSGGVALSGLQLHPNLAVLLCGTQWLSALLFAHSWAVVFTETAQMNTVKRLYYELGLRDSGLLDPDGVPFIAPSIVMLSSKWYVRVKRLGRIASPALLFTFASALLLLPITAQVLLAVAAWHLTSASLERVFFTLAPLITLCYLDVVWHHAKRISDLAWKPPS